jgi:hypothetical protein
MLTRKLLSLLLCLAPFAAQAAPVYSITVVAALAYKDGVGYAVRLDLASPVPEPANAAMLAAGLVVVGLGALPGRRTNFIGRT